MPTTMHVSSSGIHYTYVALARVKVKVANIFFQRPMILLEQHGMQAVFIDTKLQRSTLHAGMKKNMPYSVCTNHYSDWLKN